MTHGILVRVRLRLLPQCWGRISPKLSTVSLPFNKLISKTQKDQTISCVPGQGHEYLYKNTKISSNQQSKIQNISLLIKSNKAWSLQENRAQIKRTSKDIKAIATTLSYWIMKTQTLMYQTSACNFWLSKNSTKSHLWYLEGSDSRNPTNTQNPWMLNQVPCIEWSRKTQLALCIWGCVHPWMQKPKDTDGRMYIYWKKICIYMDPCSSNSCSSRVNYKYHIFR